MQPRILVAILVATITAIVLLSIQVHQTQPPSLTEDSSASSVAPTRERVEYACDEGAITVDFIEGGVTVHFSQEISSTLEETKATSGARYANEGDAIVFWEKGGSAFIEEAGKITHQNCTQSLAGIEPGPLPREEVIPAPTPLKESGECFVGGCSGQLCTDNPDAVSTCEWTEAYACYEGARCERQPDGACGWTNTPELGQCLSNAATN